MKCNDDDDDDDGDANDCWQKTNSETTNRELWPHGLRILVVENDPFSPPIHHLIHQCNYQVTSCRQVSEAISMVTEDQQRFDMVLSDVFFPNEDGLLLLKILALQLGIPVILMSWNGETSTVMKYIAHGACDYLIKPVTLQELKNIWQHIFRRVMGQSLIDRSRADKNMDFKSKTMDSWRKRSITSLLSNEEAAAEVINDVSHLKRARLQWTSQLHHQFVSAVNTLGLDKAVPKKILETMKVQQLTKEQVASHLQKYKLYLRKLSSALGQDRNKSSDNQVSLALGSKRKIDPATLNSLQQLIALEKKNDAYQAEISKSLNSKVQSRSSSITKENGDILVEDDHFCNLNKKFDQEPPPQSSRAIDIHVESPNEITNLIMEELFS
ncbi:two-component response regulator EHD1-like [Tasmannia lanceolata]|uniref:two-component response regulator EHD1-like n=1 Tax=Tasmannia lanceolata TaxID=3420 RepID=UPI004062CC76